MRKIDLLLEEYGESHLNKINKLIHWICVPAIFFSIVGLVWSIPIGFLQEFKINNFQYVNWATLTLCIVYYIIFYYPHHSQLACSFSLLDVCTLQIH